MKIFVISLMPKFLLRIYINYKLNKLSYSDIEKFNRWYRNSEIKQNVDKRKALK